MLCTVLYIRVFSLCDQRVPVVGPFFMVGELSRIKQVFGPFSEWWAGNFIHYLSIKPIDHMAKRCVVTMPRPHPTTGGKLKFDIVLNNSGWIGKGRKIPSRPQAFLNRFSVWPGQPPFIWDKYFHKIFNSMSISLRTGFLLVKMLVTKKEKWQKKKQLIHIAKLNGSQMSVSVHNHTK